MTAFDTVLVANRGEIACRIIRTLRSMGIRSVAVYSDADRDAAHVRLADVAVHIGGAEAKNSYLDVEAIVAAATRAGAGAVHPGYGFLSEKVSLAEACESAGLVFIGPRPHALEVMGDKIRSKMHVVGHGVPVIPGIAQPGLDDDALSAAAAEIGYPILIKPSAGGGGKGMYAVQDAAELPEALRAARRVASSAFGDDTLFLERLVSKPRHIEVQVLADIHGHTIHLGERECSLQRRHQKVIEEAPSALLDEPTRARIGQAACAVARSVEYVGAGTVEFLVSDDKPDEFFFMEMNTRLQVEHPVTEAVTGVDLVEWQVRIAAGETLTVEQSDVVLRGHAIEARVYAEDPQNGFLPSIGRVLAVHEPTGPGIRVDSALIEGLEISPHYDPMLAKVIAHADDRAQALARIRRAIEETVVLGVRTNVEYLAALLDAPAVVAGALDTTLIERTLPELSFLRIDDELLTAAALIVHEEAWRRGSDAPWSRPTGWRILGAQPVRYRFVFGEGERADVLVSGPPDAAHARVDRLDGDGDGDGDGGSDGSGSDGAAPPSSRVAITVDGDGARIGLERDGVRRTMFAARNGEELWLAAGTARFELTAIDRATVIAAQLAGIEHGDHAADPQVRSPMPGTVISVDVADGDAVSAGTSLLTVEAMKMEHRLTAPIDGTVSISIRPGETVKASQLVATVSPETPHKG
jgi:acetyl-CoA/propionyl-CoA carboxylase biotin carboxyl carrier protein